MFDSSPEELVGYVASALVVISLSMTSVVRLRILSLAGGLTFVVYGFLIDSAPIVITNAAVAVINCWYLWREFNPRSKSGVELGASPIRADSPFLQDFLAFHQDDIAKFQPDFELRAEGDVVALLLTRDGLPAGVVIGRRLNDCLFIDLDYVLGAYRDTLLGHWIYEKGSEVFGPLGIKRLYADAPTEAHRKYLQRVGFEPAEDSPTHEFERKI